MSSPCRLVGQAGSCAHRQPQEGREEGLSGAERNRDLQVAAGPPEDKVTCPLKDEFCFLLPAGQSWDCPLIVPGAVEEVFATIQ